MQVVKTSSGIHIALRSMRDADLPFVMRAIMMQMRKAVPFRSWTNEQISQHRIEVVEPLIAGLPPIIACHKEDPGVLLGLICFQAPDVLHFLYVKERFRRIGVADALMARAFGSEHGTVSLTHSSSLLRTDKRLCTAFMSRYRLMFNPYNAAVK